MTIAKLHPDKRLEIYQANLALTQAIRAAEDVYIEGRRVSKRPILYTLRWARADTFIAHWYHGTSDSRYAPERREIHIISTPFPRTHPPVSVDWAELPALGKLEVVFMKRLRKVSLVKKSPLMARFFMTFLKQERPQPLFRQRSRML